jgi:hypothetical protein
VAFEGRFPREGGFCRYFSPSHLLKLLNKWEHTWMLPYENRLARFDQRTRCIVFLRLNGGHDTREAGEIIRVAQGIVAGVQVTVQVMGDQVGLDGRHAVIKFPLGFGQ